MAARALPGGVPAAVSVAAGLLVIGLGCNSVAGSRDGKRERGLGPGASLAKSSGERPDCGAAPPAVPDRAGRCRAARRLATLLVVF